MRYNIRIEVEEDDGRTCYQGTASRECGDADLEDQLLSAVESLANSVIRSCVNPEFMRKIG